MKKLLLLLSVAAMLVACGSGNTNPDELVLIDYEALENADFFSTKTFSKVEPVYLDTNAAVLGSPLYMIMKNGNYYILDRQQEIVYTFDASGKMLGKLSKRGRAKGEYTLLFDFDIHNNGNIVLLCNPKPKLITYNPNGELIEEKDIDFQCNSVMIYNDGYLFAKDWRETPNTGKNTIVRTDAGLNILGGMLPENDFRFANWGQRTFSRSGDNGLPVYKNVYDNNVYRVVNDTLQTAYRIEFGKMGYPEEMFTMAETEDVFNLVMNNTFASIDRAFENNDYLVLSIDEAEGLENNSCYLLYDKAAKKSTFQKISSGDEIAGCFGKPMELTPDNELVFLAEPEALKELAEENPLLKSVDTSKLQEGCGYVILKMKIK